GAADGADRIASAPMVRQVLRVLGTQHDGPVARPGKECLQEAPRHANTLTPRDLEDRVLRRQAHDAIPGAAPEAAVHVLLETGPGRGEGVSRWHRACNLRAAREAVNPERTWVSSRGATTARGLLVQTPCVGEGLPRRLGPPVGPLTPHRIWRKDHVPPSRRLPGRRSHQHVLSRSTGGPQATHRSLRHPGWGPEEARLLRLDRQEPRLFPDSDRGECHRIRWLAGLNTEEPAG